MKRIIHLIIGIIALVTPINVFAEVESITFQDYEWGISYYELTKPDSEGHWDFSVYETIYGEQEQYTAAMINVDLYPLFVFGTDTIAGYSGVYENLYFMPQVKNGNIVSDKLIEQTLYAAEYQFWTDDNKAAYLDLITKMSSLYEEPIKWAERYPVDIFTDKLKGMEEGIVWEANDGSIARMYYNNLCVTIEYFAPNVDEMVREYGEAEGKYLFDKKQDEQTHGL